MARVASIPSTPRVIARSIPKTFAMFPNTLSCSTTACNSNSHGWRDVS